MAKVTITTNKPDGNGDVWSWGNFTIKTTAIDDNLNNFETVVTSNWNSHGYGLQLGPLSYYGLPHKPVEKTKQEKHMEAF
jgi:hypothetical protein